MTTEKFCSDCGAKIKAKTEICPKCGVRQQQATPKSKTVAILLSVFLSAWTWLYTYKKDSWKFWVGLVSNLLLFWTFVVPIGIWIWAIVDTAVKDETFFTDY